MTLSPRQLAELAQRLSSDKRFGLDAAELDAVLSWVSGSERRGADELIRHLGVPRERLGLTRSILTRLDAQLFKDGKLIEQQAHVHTDIGHDERKARFRRLMAAFHPDSHAQDSEWLTPRSQAIHDAWSRFRRGQGGQRERGRPTTDSRHVVRHRDETTAPPERRSAKLIPDIPGPLMWLMARLRAVRHLQSKALLIIAVVACLPVAWVYFSYQPYRDGLNQAPLPHPADYRSEKPFTLSAGPDRDHATSDETELRITELLGSFRDTFERGQLDGLLGHFTDHPRENSKTGRRWLRQNYQSLFESSNRRRLSIVIDDIMPHENDWLVLGRFDLHVDYSEREPVRIVREVRYLIKEEHEQFRIASIDY